MIEVSGKLQLNSHKISNTPDPSRIKILVIPLGKDPQPGEVLAEGKGNTEKIERKGKEERCGRIEMPSMRNVTIGGSEDYNHYIYFHVIGYVYVLIKYSYFSLLSCKCVNNSYYL